MKEKTKTSRYYFIFHSNPSINISYVEIKQIDKYVYTMYVLFHIIKKLFFQIFT